jgi:hypothetical protein
MYKINLINRFLRKEVVKSFKESFTTCKVFFKQVLYLRSQSIKYPYDNKCFRKSTPLNFHCWS